MIQRLIAFSSNQVPWTRSKRSLPTNHRSHLCFIADATSLSKPDTKLEFLLGEAVVEEKAAIRQGRKSMLHRKPTFIFAGAQRVGRPRLGLTSGLGTEFGAASNAFPPSLSGRARLAAVAKDTASTASTSQLSSGSGEL
jgi:hypothetical protein